MPAERARVGHPGGGGAGVGTAAPPPGLLAAPPVPPPAEKKAGCAHPDGVAMTLVSMVPGIQSSPRPRGGTEGIRDHRPSGLACLQQPLRGPDLSPSGQRQGERTTRVAGELTE